MLVSVWSRTCCAQSLFQRTVDAQTYPTTCVSSLPCPTISSSQTQAESLTQIPRANPNAGVAVQLAATAPACVMKAVAQFMVRNTIYMQCKGRWRQSTSAFENHMLPADAAPGRKLIPVRVHEALPKPLGHRHSHSIAYQRPSLCLRYIRQLFQTPKYT